MRRFATRLWMSFVRALANSMRGDVVRINARACFALLRVKRACREEFGEKILSNLWNFHSSFFFNGRKEPQLLSYEIFFIPVITSGLITRIRFYETRKQDGEWERESRQQLTQYPRCNPTSVSWASPVGDDELHTRENKTKWNGGGRWADIVTQSNTRNQTVPRPRCLESNTRHSTVLYALCYDVSNL